jgi:hypothetical protein
MTEAEWLACTDPASLLVFLKDRATDRKLRLFSCACCRRIWDLLTDERSQQAIVVTEEYVDGKVGAKALDQATAAAEDVYQQINLDRNEPDYPDPDAALLLESAAYAAWEVCISNWRSREITHAYHYADAKEVASAVVESLGEGMDRQSSERCHQADLIRCIFGNPFQPVTVNPSWLAWNDGTVAKLAEAIYKGRDFDRLAVLADALEEAGCHDADILGHCRHPGPHIRGCWVVDLLLRS